MTRSRLLARVGIGLLAAPVVAFVALRLFLMTPMATGLVAVKIGAASGLPTSIKGVRVGLGASELSGLELREAGADSTSAPWVTVGTLNAAVKLPSLLGGATPNAVTFRDAAVTLRFDADNNLLTKLPPSTGANVELPASIRVENGTLTFQNAGRPAETFHGLDAVLTHEAEKLSLKGTVDDADWGKWAVSGGVDAATGASELRLTNGGRDVTMAILKRIPFVPPSVWEAVEVEGDTPVDLTLRFTPRTAGGLVVNYRVDLKPERTHVHVAAIDLSADDARGGVVVEDNLVLLRDVRGRVADGTLLLKSSDLDFRGPATDLRFDLTGQKLNYGKLPESWRLPKLFGGEIAAEAKLGVVIKDGKTDLHGQGEGAVDPAYILGQKSPQPVKLLLRASNGRFDILPETPQSRWFNEFRDRIDQRLNAQPVNYHRSR